MTETTNAPITGQASELGFEIISHVTRPLLKLELGKAVFVRFDSAIYEADPIVKTRRKRGSNGEASTTENVPAGGKFDAPPMLADVYDLVNKRESQMIVNAVLQSELDKKYKDAGYKGLSFRIIKNQLAGKSYATFEIAEVKLRGEAEQTTQQSAAPAKHKK